jgi:hypothetical protein
MSEKYTQKHFRFKKGQRFTVYNGSNAKGEPEKEGFATLVKLVGGTGSETESFGNYWLVRFEDEPETVYPRFVQENNLCA